jgi:hypothetical protein
MGKTAESASTTISYEKLDPSREECRDRFRNAEPFPHLVIDGLFQLDGIRQAAEQFPSPREMPEKLNRKGVLELSDRSLLPPLLRQVSDELASQRFVAWLSFMSGLDGLFSDSQDNWGALRQCGDDVEGKIHAPPGQPGNRRWSRRLSLILHLSEGLTENNGGALQLWDRDKTAPRASITPLFNRAVVFLNVPTAYHSASRTRLAPGQMRRTMQSLYFTEGAPEAAQA